MTMPSLHPYGIRIPAAWEAHSYCWMAWAVHPEWGDYVEPVKRELREIIVTISEFEPVRVLVPPDQIRDAQGQSFGPNVEIIEAPVDDIWMRDIAPTFALSELCRNLGDEARSGGVVCRHFEDLDAVFESDTCDNLRQVICAF